MRFPRLASIALVTGCALLAVGGEADAAGSKVDQLSRALLTDSSFKVRTQAALLLGKLGDQAGVEPLIRGLGDDNKTVRGMAAQALGKLGGDKAALALKVLLAKEKEAFVRRHAQQALAAIARLSATQGGGERKLYLKIGPFTGGTRAADTELLWLLRGIMQKALGDLQHVGMLEGGAGDRAALRSGKPAFLVDGNVLKLEDHAAGSGSETKCEVKVLVARLPSRSVILWTSAGAAVQSGKRERDRQNARHDCIEASADQLADSLVGYFKAQGGG
jgi:hypothetical protein